MSSRAVKHLSTWVALKIVGIDMKMVCDWLRFFELRKLGNIQLYNN